MDRRHLLAVGLENGQIHLFTAPLDNLSTFSPFLVLDPSYVSRDLATDTVADR